MLHMPDEDLQERKSALRRKMLARRRAFSPTERRALDAVIRERAMQLPVLQRARTVMLYASTADEIDLFPLMTALLEKGRRAAFPEITGKGMMEARELSSPDLLIEGAFGILTPDPARSVQIPPDEIDLIIVPGAAFSADGSRLGLGGGYYDRYLPRAEGACRLVLAYDVQVVSEIPTGTQDALVDCILTERRTICCRDAVMNNLEEEV